MKTALLLSLPLLFTVSCSRNARLDPAAPPASPIDQNQYGIPEQSPYGAPAQQGAYTPQANAPYQPINPPAAIPGNIPTAPPLQIPDAAPELPPITGGQSYTIQKGDTLWGLSRRYGVSVEAIRQANNITGDNIMTGSTLTIPAH